MLPPDEDKFFNALKGFADDLRVSYGSLVAAQQEDQLKGPTGKLLSAFGDAFGRNVVTADELPDPAEEERKPPRLEVDSGQDRLH